MVDKDVLTDYSVSNETGFLGKVSYGKGLSLHTVAHADAWASVLPSSILAMHPFGGWVSGLCSAHISHERTPGRLTQTGCP
jgi:hypothetical protein